MVAAAIVGGAIIAGAGTAIAGSEAASATTSAANTASADQRAALAQQAQLAAPYTALGQSAIPTYQALLGIGGPSPGSGGGGPQPTGANYNPKYGPMGPGYPWLAPGVPNPNFPKDAKPGVTNAATGQPTTASPGTFAGGGGSSIEQTLQNLPGYQFTKDQGIQATEAQLSAMGLGKSGNVLTAVDQYTTGLADQNYQQYLGDIQGAVGLGQAAAAGQASNIGTAAGNLSNIAIGQGNTLAGIYANETAGLTKAAGNATDQYLTNQTLQNLNPGAWSYGAPGTVSAGGGYIPPDSAPGP